MSLLQNLFNPQVNTDNAKERSLGLLKIVLVYSLVATIVIAPISFLSERYVTSVVSMSVFGIILVCLYLMGRGHLKAASFISLFTFLVTTMYTSYIGDGINDISILIIPGILVIAALLLDKKIFLTLSIIAICTLALIPFLRDYSGIKNLNENELAAEIITAIVILITIAAGIRVLFISLIESLNRLKINETKYKNIFENIQDIYYEIRLDGTIIEVSPGIKGLLGINRDDLLHQSLIQFYENPARHEHFINELKVSQKVENFEVRLEDSDQSSHTVLINATLKENLGHSDQFVVGSIRDITEKKMLETQLLQSQKLDSIGRLAGGVAHDFNNLLTIISGHSELAIEKRYQEKQELDEDLQAIKSASAKATGLTRQLLAFSRNQVYEQQIINPNLVIIELEKMLRRIIGEDIEIQVRLSSMEGLLIKADPTQIEQILMNLIVNARDAIRLKSNSSHEKNIIIETTERKIDKSYSDQILESKPGRYFVLSVSDSGIGMEPRTQQNIFEPFFTTKKEGTGLGLSMVYGIVKQNDGFINVYSEENAGTVIKIFWPLKEGKEVAYKKSIDKDDLRGDECILLVEDDDQVRRYAGTVLKMYGHKVFETADGQEAAQLFIDKQKEIDLVISDMIMPKMNGIELSKKLHDIKNNIKILLISGYTENHLSNEDISKKKINYLQKPFSGKELMIKVREILDK
jgi:PAS domain S-box-containing protein